MTKSALVQVPEDLIQIDVLERRLGAAELALSEVGEALRKVISNRVEHDQMTDDDERDAFYDALERASKEQQPVMVKGPLELETENEALDAAVAVARALLAALEAHLAARRQLQESADALEEGGSHV